MTDLIGQSLGRYHILEQLGEGGMAVVYKAFDTRLERNVAIKVILPSKEHSEKFLKRFEREAKALASLSHPNIVKVIDYGEHDGLPYLVMEYLPGGTLKQKLANNRVSWQEAAKLLIPLAQALAYAHESKIIHRDIKSSNILITQSGEPMLSDFGIAKMLEAEETMDLTGTGVGVGTPEYMSPEQAQGKQVDARSDIYSLGVVLYEMITGRKPYQADTPYAVVIKHVNEPLPRPKDFVRELPAAIEGILLKALAKIPSDRFQDMRAFGASLEKSLAGIKARTDEPKYNRIKRPHLLFGVIGLAVLIVFSIGAFLRSAGMRATSQPAIIPAQPSATSTSVPNREFSNLIFEDDFESGTNLSWERMPKGWKVIEQDGNHVLLAERLADNSGFGAGFGSPTWQDYCLTFRFIPIGPGTPSLYVSVRHGFHDAPGSGSFRYALDFNLDSHLYFNKRILDRESTLQTTPLGLQLNQWYDIEITVDGPHISGLINDQEILDYKDSLSPLLSGYVVFETWDGSTINFDNGTGGATKILLDDIAVYSK